MGYKFQFVTLAGFHSLNHGMFELSQGYAKRGMAAYAELQQVCAALCSDCASCCILLLCAHRAAVCGLPLQLSSVRGSGPCVICSRERCRHSMWLHTHYAPTSAMCMLTVATGAHPCVCHVCSWRWLPRPGATPPPSTSARSAPATLMWSPPSVPTAPLPPSPWLALLRPRSSRLTGSRGLPKSGPGRAAWAPCPLPEPPNSFESGQA